MVQKQLKNQNSSSFLRDMVFGAYDGVVTTIGFLVGFAGSTAQQNVIAIAGLLGIIAGSTSMALGNYLAVKSQREFYDETEKIEKQKIEDEPEKEKDAVRKIYKDLGFNEESVGILTKEVTCDKEFWLDVMMRDKLGLTREESPTVAGLLTALFYLAGGVPLALPFIFLRPITRALLMSIFIAVLVMGFIGILRWWFDRGSVGKRIVETVVIGLLAAAIGFLAGEALQFLGIGGVPI